MTATSIPSIDTGKTFGELLLELAVRTGEIDFPVGGGAAELPDPSTETYRRLAEAFNRGYKRFLHHKEWSFLTRPLEITLYADGDGPYNIEGDAARYRLPHWCRGGPGGSGHFTYTDRLSAYRLIQPMPFEYVVRKHNIITGSGPPSMFGIGPIQGMSGAEGPGTDMELILWPTPGATYNIRAAFYLREHKLVALSQRHIAGAEHDDCILAHAIWCCYESDVLSPERDGAREAVVVSLADSMRMDNVPSLGLKGTMVNTAEDEPRGYIPMELRVNGVPMVPGT